MNSQFYLGAHFAHLSIETLTPSVMLFARKNLSLELKLWISAGNILRKRSLLRQSLQHCGFSPRLFGSFSKIFPTFANDFQALFWPILMKLASRSSDSDDQRL